MIMNPYDYQCEKGQVWNSCDLNNTTYLESVSKSSVAIIMSSAFFFGVKVIFLVSRLEVQ